MSVVAQPQTTSPVAPAPTSVRRARTGPPRRVGRRAAPFLFLAPYLFFLAAFGAAPALYGLYTSFHSGSSFGLGSWTAVLKDPRVVTAVQHVAAYLVLWLPTLLLTVVAVALLLHARPNRFSTTMRLVYYLPGAITGSAAALLWLFMVSPQVSPFGPVLRALHVSSATEALTGGKLPFVLAIMSLAIHAGGWIVVLYGALISLPEDVLEASSIDGCNAWQTAWHVKLPLVRRWLTFILITNFAVGTQVFVEPQVMSTGVPGQISPTWSVNQLAYYYATQEGDFGKAAALSIALLAVGLVVALLLLFGTRFYELDRER